MRIRPLIALGALVPAVLFPQYAYAGEVQGESGLFRGSLTSYSKIENGSVRITADIPYHQSLFSYIQPEVIVAQNRQRALASVTSGTRRAIQNNQRLGTISVQPFTRRVTVTAYSSTPDQTDASPFITAAGTHVRDGIVAANFLPFGTKIKFPNMFGEKVFVVEDRTARRYSNRVDIWFPDRHSALQFGRRTLIVEVIGNS